MFAADEAEVGASVDDVDPGEEDMRALTIWDNLATLIVSKIRNSIAIFLYQIQVLSCPGADIGEAQMPASVDASAHAGMLERIRAQQAMQRRC